MDWGSESGVKTEGAIGLVLVFLHRCCMCLPAILDAVVLAQSTNEDGVSTRTKPFLEGTSTTMMAAIILYS